MQSLAQTSGGAVPAGTAYPAEPLSATYPQPAADLASSTSDEPLDLLASNGAPVSQARVRHLTQREIVQMDERMFHEAATFFKTNTCASATTENTLNYGFTAARALKNATHNVLGVRPERLERRYVLYFEALFVELLSGMVKTDVLKGGVE